MPALNICGLPGSGKTVLLTRLVQLAYPVPYVIISCYGFSSIRQVGTKINLLQIFVVYSLLLVILFIFQCCVYIYIYISLCVAGGGSLE